MYIFVLVLKKCSIEKEKLFFSLITDDEYDLYKKIRRKSFSGEKLKGREVLMNNDFISFIKCNTDVVLKSYRNSLLTNKVKINKETYRQKYYKYLKSEKWASIKNKLLIEKHCMCERCYERGAVHVHHKTYKRVFNERLSDLEVLCPRCHMEEHGI